MSSTNPLWSFRKPEAIKRETGEAHFNTQREDVINDTGMLNVYPGDFTYKDPTLEMDFGFWEDNGTPQSFATLWKMTGREGFEIAKAEEFKVSERIALAWQKDSGGRLTIGGADKNTMVLMFRTGEKASESQKKRLSMSDSVQQSVEEREAQLRGTYEREGVRIAASIEDDDGSDSDEATRRVRSRSRR